MTISKLVSRGIKTVGAEELYNSLRAEPEQELEGLGNLSVCLDSALVRPVLRGGQVSFLNSRIAPGPGDRFQQTACQPSSVSA